MTSSRLFHLVPLAIASTEIESLTSYIRRLAFAHVVSPSTLVRELVLKPRQQVMATANLMFEPTRISESLNGASASTTVTISALEVLTGRRDLRATTFSALADGIELRSAFRRFRAWCPACMSEGEPYDRLAWSLSAWQTCAIHHIPLRDRCEQCGSRHRPLAARATVTSCPTCRVSLGRLVTAETVGLPESQRIAGRLLALQSQGLWLGRESSAGLIRAAVEETGGFRPLAKLSGVSPSELIAVASSRVRPSLATFIRCSVFAPRALDRLELALTPTRIAWAPSAPGDRERRSAPIAPQIKDSLRATLALPDGNLPSLRSFAKSSGVTPAYLRAALPDGTDQLLARRKAAVHSRRTQREQRLAVAVSATLAAMAIGGAPWTRRELEARLPRGGLLRVPALRSIFRSTLPYGPEARAPFGLRTAKSDQSGVTSRRHERLHASSRPVGASNDRI